MTQPATNRQIPESAILDHYNKQKYLGNAYKFVLNFTSAGTTEVAELLLVNASVTTSGFPSGYTSLFVDVRSLAGLTASNSAIIRTYLNPTVTSAGAAQTPINLRKASTNTSIATLTSAPTVSANGTLVHVLSVAANTSAETGELIILDPGQSLLITVQTSATSTATAIGLGWSEI